jgi:hypothetical protein
MNKQRLSLHHLLFICLVAAASTAYAGTSVQHRQVVKGKTLSDCPSTYYCETMKEKLFVWGYEGGNAPGEIICIYSHSHH